MKLFSIGVNELFEPIVSIVLLRKGDGCLLFFKSIFWRKRSLSDAVGDFALKNAKLGREICNQKFDFVEKKFAVRKIIRFI